MANSLKISEKSPQWSFNGESFRRRLLVVREQFHLCPEDNKMVPAVVPVECVTGKANRRRQLEASPRTGGECAALAGREFLSGRLDLVCHNHIGHSHDGKSTVDKQSRQAIRSNALAGKQSDSEQQRKMDKENKDERHWLSGYDGSCGCWCCCPVANCCSGEKMSRE